MLQLCAKDLDPRGCKFIGRGTEKESEVRGSQDAATGKPEKMKDVDRNADFPISGDLLVKLTEAQPRLLGYLVKRLGDLETAREVLQDVNLVICRRASEFRPGSHFLAWAFTIAKFELLAYRKRMSRERLVFNADLVASLDRMDESLFPADGARNREEALQVCLDQLDERHQELLTRRYAESLSVKALAAELNKTANAVSMTLHRIREQLMQCVDRRLSGLSDDYV
ncbi:MAG: sigma-70 family RNA polymerase sigma factor [Planctomycetota bacterium]